MGCQQIEKATKPKHRKGLWSPEEDNKLRNHILKYGHGCWSSVPIKAGLQRNGKSCRLRWINYLRPGLKRGMFSKQEEDTILTLHNMLGNKWSQIAQRLPGRTDNEIKNYWHSYLKKKMAKANQMVESNQQIQYATSSSDTGDNSFSPEKLAIHHDPSYGLLNNMEKLLGAQYSDQSYEHNYNFSSKEACNQSSLPKLLFAEWLSLDQVNGGGPVNSNESLVLGNEFEQSSTFQETTLMMHMSEEGPFCEEYHNNNNMYHSSLTTQSSSIEDQNSELKFSNQVVGNEFIQHCISSGVDLCNNFSLNNNDEMYV